MKKLVFILIICALFQSCKVSKSVLFESPQPANDGEVLTEFPTELRGNWNRIEDSLFIILKDIRSNINFDKKGDLIQNEFVKQEKNGEITVYFPKSTKSLKAEQLTHYQSKSELIKALEEFDSQLISINNKQIKISPLMNEVYLQFLSDYKLTYEIGTDIVLKKWNGNYFINKKVTPFENDSCVSSLERKKTYWETYILYKNTDGNWILTVVYDAWDRVSNNEMKFAGADDSQIRNDGNSQRLIYPLNLTSTDVKQICEKTTNQVLLFKGDVITRIKQEIVEEPTDYYREETKEAALKEAQEYGKWNLYMDYLIQENTGFNLYVDIFCTEDCIEYDPSSEIIEWKGELNKEKHPIGKWIQKTNSGKLLSYINFGNNGQFEGDFEIRSPWNELIVSGNMLNGKRNGKWVFNNRYNQKRVEGNYSNGLKNGEWNWYILDKKYKTAHFENDVLNGQYIAYEKWVNNVEYKLEEGTFENNQKKNWKTYYNKKKKPIEEKKGDYFIEENSRFQFLDDVVIDTIVRAKSEIKSNSVQFSLDGLTLLSAMEYDSKGTLRFKAKNGKFYNYNEDGKVIQSGSIKGTNLILEEGIDFYDYQTEIRYKVTNNKLTFYSVDNKVIGEGRVVFDENSTFYQKSSTLYLYTENDTISNENTDYEGEMVSSNGREIFYTKIGDWKYYYPNGTIKYEGEFCCDGYYCGEWKGYYPNGNIAFKGEFKQGEISPDPMRANIFSEYYENGKIKDVTLYKPYGYSINELDKTSYWPNGKIFEKYKRNLNGDHGLQQVFYENGQLMLEYNAIDGQIIGNYKSYYSSGKVKLISNYILIGSKGVLDGLLSEYYENGNIKTKVIFSKGVPIGKIEMYYENGNPKVIGEYIEVINSAGRDDYDLLNETQNKLIYNDNPNDLLGEIVDSLDYTESIGLPYTYQNAFFQDGVFTHHYSEPINEWVFYYPNGKVKQKGKYESSATGTEIQYEEDTTSLYFYYGFELRDDILKESTNNESITKESNEFDYLIPDSYYMLTGWKFYDEKGKKIKSKKSLDKNDKFMVQPSKNQKRL